MTFIGLMLQCRPHCWQRAPFNSTFLSETMNYSAVIALALGANRSCALAFNLIRAVSGGKFEFPLLLKNQRASRVSGQVRSEFVILGAPIL
jgi:hypothetical protein